jgi:hypothetical protein
MATQAQFLANRENTRHSTGPQTPEGKARSARNALKHGFYSAAFLVDDGEREHFDALENRLRSEIGPLDAVGEDFFVQYLHAAWNLHRLRRLENRLYADYGNPFFDPETTYQLELIARHRVRFERSQSAALKELRAHLTALAGRAALPAERQAEAPSLADMAKVCKTRLAMAKVYPPPAPPLARGGETETAQNSGSQPPATRAASAPYVVPPEAGRSPAAGQVG